MIDILFDISWYIMLYITIGFIQTYVLYLAHFKYYTEDVYGKVLKEDFLQSAEDILVAINMWPVMSIMVFLNLFLKFSIKAEVTDEDN